MFPKYDHSISSSFNIFFTKICHLYTRSSNKFILYVLNNLDVQVFVLNMIIVDL